MAASDPDTFARVLVRLSCEGVRIRGRWLRHHPEWVRLRAQYEEEERRRLARLFDDPPGEPRSRRRG